MITEGLQIPIGIQPVNPVPVDTWSGPYTGLTEALNSIPIEIRFPTMEVRILNDEGNKMYWFKDGINDYDLVPFIVDLTPVITGETEARISGDTMLFNMITGETDNRIQQDIILHNEITGLTYDFNSHTGNTLNPHNTTASQIGVYTTGQTDNLLIGKSNTGHTHYQLYQPNGSNPFVYTDNGGTLHIDGDIVQSGSTYETHAEQIYTSKDYIYLRSGSTESLANGEYTGFEAIKYDGVNNGRLVFDKDGWARVGDVGSEQKLATIEESTSNDYLMKYNTLTNRLEGIDPINLTGHTHDYLPLTGGTVTGKLNSTISDSYINNISNFRQIEGSLTRYTGNTSTVTEGIYENIAYSGTTNVSGLYGINTFTRNLNSATIANLYGLQSYVRNDGPGKSTNIVSGYFSTRNNTTGSFNKMLGMQSVLTNNSGDLTNNDMYGMSATINIGSTGFTDGVVGITSYIYNNGIINEATGVGVYFPTIGNVNSSVYGVKIGSDEHPFSGTPPNLYGLYIHNSVTGGTVNGYGIYSDTTLKNYLKGGLGIKMLPTNDALSVSGNTFVYGNVTGTTFVKSGGTSNQFLKADGSIDSNTYTTTGQTNTLRKLLSCGPITNVVVSGNTSGIVNISSIDANFNTNDDFTGNINTYTVPALNNLQLVANQYTYITAQYSGGTTQYVVTTDNNIINHSTILNVVQLYWENLNSVNEIHIFYTGSYGLGLSNKIGHRLLHTERFGYESGLILGEYGTRNISISSGRLWYDCEEIDTLSVSGSTAGHESHFYYPVGGVFNVSKVSQYPNTKYSNGVNLANLTGDKYTSVFVWKCVNSTDRCNFIMLGGEYNSVADALTSKLPSIMPDVIVKQGKFIGRIVIQNNQNVASQITNELTSSIGQTPVTNHNSLSNIQGGTTDEYYHLTSNQVGKIDSLETTYLALTGGTLTGNISLTTGATFSPVSDSASAIRFNKFDGTQVIGIDTINSRVKIGTGAPTQALDVTGIIQASASLYAAGGGAAVDASSVRVNSNGVVKFGNSSTGSSAELSIINKNVEAIRINNSGNVGIGTTTPSYKLDVCGTTATDGIRSAMGFDIYQVPDPTAPTGVVSSGGSVDTGAHWYAVSYYTSLGETHIVYTASQITTTAGNNTVTLTIPVSSDPRVIGRKIYRTKAGGLQYQEYLLATIANNTDITYIDTTADSALTGNQSVGYFRLNTTSKNITVNSNKYFTLDQNGTFVGYNAGLSLTTGGRLVLIGQGAGSSITTGNDNTVIGHYAGTSTITGANNTFIGSYAGLSNTTGSDNIFLGAYSGRFLSDGTTNNINSSTSIYIGRDTKASAASGSNEIIIGCNATGNGSNSVTLGSDSITKTVLKGRVGIGIAAPTSTLHVLHTGSDNILLIEDETSTDASPLRINSVGEVTMGSTNSTDKRLSVFGLSNGDGIQLCRVSATSDDYTSLLFNVSQINNAIRKGGIFFQRKTSNGRGNIIIATNNVDNSNDVTPTSTNNIVLTASGNVGVNTLTPTAKFSVSEKSAMNEIGGFMIRLTNHSGANSVKGTVVYASPTNDNGFTLNPIDGDMPFGVVFEAGIANGQECWVVVNGIAEVLLVDTVATTRSYIAYSSGTVAGRIDTAASVPAATTHFREIGHTIESKAGGTNVLVKCVLHFN